MECILLVEDQLKFLNNLLLLHLLALGLDADNMPTTDSFTEEKGKNMRKLDFLNRHDIAEVEAKVGS